MDTDTKIRKLTWEQLVSSPSLHAHLAGGRVLRISESIINNCLTTKLELLTSEWKPLMELGTKHPTQDVIDKAVVKLKDYAEYLFIGQEPK